jgi:hypothetical protein
MLKTISVHQGAGHRDGKPFELSRDHEVIWIGKINDS